MSLIDASEESTPSTAPIETLVVGEESACEMRLARHAFVRLVGARGRARDDQRGDQRQPCEPEAEERRSHQKACPMLT